MPRLNAFHPVVLQDGTMAPHFRDFLRKMEAMMPIIGSGSPEGVVEAPQYSIYINTAGASGSIEYRKMLTDIAGDRSQGWVAV